MKLDCIVTACNNNPLYIEFIPYFIKTWKKLYPLVDIRVIFIGEEIPSFLKLFAHHLILFPPLPNMSTAFVSQYIRLLYPCLLDYENGVMVTDIDNVPLNRTYFSKNIEPLSNDKWINLRDWQEDNQISICWQVATPQTWREVIKITSWEDIKIRLNEVYGRINYIDGHGKSGWCTDQLDLYRLVMCWRLKTNRYVVLPDCQTGYNRLCRDSFPFTDPNLENNIRNGVYSDYHCLRPHKKYGLVNARIYDLL